LWCKGDLLISLLQEGIAVSGIASHKVMGRQACHHKAIEIVYDCKDNDQMIGLPTYGVILLQLTALN